MKREKGKRLPSLKDVLSFETENADSRKLRLLEGKLESALGCQLSEQLVDDPIAIRRRLVEWLRSEKTKPGTIQSLEQCYMGAIRRAAVKGLIAAPPEGPWTRAWQSVLDLSSGVPSSKAPLRSLAGWATARQLDPGDLKDENLEDWAKHTMIDTRVLVTVRKVLESWSPEILNTALPSDLSLSNRLLKKAARGTVRESVQSKASS